jgi:hypothetical protein
MNKDVLNQLPPEEQPIASELNSVVENIQLSQSFQWELENLLMERAKTTQTTQSFFTKIMIPTGWAVAALCAIFLLTWAIRSLVPAQPLAGATPTPQASFEEKVRKGDICASPLALAHDFDVFLTNPNKIKFATLDPEKTIGELRSFAWASNGRQLALVGNTAGSGNIYLTNSSGDQLQPILSDSPVGYLMDAAWSHDGKQFLMWSVQNNKTLYLVNADGTGFVEKQLDLQIFGTPQFTPDNQSLIFYGGDSSSSGLFELKLDGSESRLMSTLVEDESGYAISQDGSQVAYIEMDRNMGEARLVVKERTTNNKVVIATLPIPKGSGSSIPSSANLGWSPDGKALAFDFGRGMTDRAVYFAYEDGSGLVQMAQSAYAPTISADGKCLAYISDKKVFLIDLNGISSTSARPKPVLLAELPVGRAIADFRLDKLQWRP